MFIQEAVKDCLVIGAQKVFAPELVRSHFDEVKGAHRSTIFLNQILADYEA